MATLVVAELRVLACTVSADTSTRETAAASRDFSFCLSVGRHDPSLHEERHRATIDNAAGSAGNQCQCRAKVVGVRTTFSCARKRDARDRRVTLSWGNGALLTLPSIARTRINHAQFVPLTPPHLTAVGVCRDS